MGIRMIITAIAMTMAIMAMRTMIMRTDMTTTMRTAAADTTITTMATSRATEAESLARLLLWFSPAFPIGAFSFSHGLEWAVEAGDIADRDGLQAWLEGLVRQGSGWSDAVVFAACHGAAEAGSLPRLRAAAEFAVALQPTKERRLEATMQGDAFVKAVETAWENRGLALLRAACDPPYALAAAAGAAAGGAGFQRETALRAFLTGFCQNLVSAAVRLAPIGQSDGLRVLAALEPAIAETADAAARSSLRDAGGLAFRSDIASMRHETQITRLFRS
jgi:urease accessory protein